eukprot:329759_1
MVVYCRLLHNLRLAISILVLSHIILNTEGQSSYGLVDGATSISATSTFTSDGCQPADAKYSVSDECWCSATQDCSDNPILTINLGAIYKITRVGVKSCSWVEYLTSYKIQYYYGATWTWYKNGQSLTGNNGCCTETATWLSPLVIATHIRLYPLTAQSWCSTNFEVYGYPWTPTESPTHAPTPRPTLTTRSPTHAPTKNPTSAPTSAPTVNPTPAPTANPTPRPTQAPTNNPTSVPTNAPSMVPTFSPTHNPTFTPTHNPTLHPTKHTTTAPTLTPTNAPLHRTLAPSYSPTISPTSDPTYSPSNVPIFSPTLAPTRYPTDSPSRTPSSSP